MTLTDDLVAAFRASSQEAARDRRALIAEALAASLGGQAAAARELDVSRQEVGRLCERAAQVRADSRRLADATAPSGPIPTAQSDRRAS